MSRQGEDGFWDRGATWKAVLLLAVYLACYLAVGRVVAWAFADRTDGAGLSATALVAVALPIVVGGAGLLVLTARIGWLREVFGPQPVTGRRWMWAAPALVAATVVAHLAGVSWDRWNAGQLIALVVLGASVGLTEELATRGLAVTVLRRAGHGERYVAVVSSLLFALMHTVNLFSGMSARTVLATVVYTFGFGMCMYLTMRVTGTIWAAIVLHGLTDPTTVLSAGGIDQAGAGGAVGAPVLVTVLTLGLVVLGFVAILLVRGAVSRGSGHGQPAASS